MNAASPALVPISWGLEDMLYHEPAGISTLLVNELRLAGFPDLEGGRIRLGSGQLTSRVAPPSVVAEWAQSRGTGVEYGRENVQRSADPGQPISPILNSVGTDILEMHYHVWAQDAAGTVGGSIDAARYLCHMLWRVIHYTAIEGSYEVIAIQPKGQPKSMIGYEATLIVQHHTVVCDGLLMYLPPGTKARFAVSTVGAGPADTVIVR